VFSDTRLGDVTESTLDSSTTPSSLYIWNKNYPNSSPASMTTSSCSIETVCGSTISVLVIDVRFVQDTSNVCQQSLTFKDNTISHTINCNDNNNFDIRQLFQSTTSYLTMEFRNDYISTGGFFWIGFSSKRLKNLNVLKCQIRNNFRRNYHIFLAG